MTTPNVTYLPILTHPAGHCCVVPFVVINDVKVTRLELADGLGIFVVASVDCGGGAAEKKISYRVDKKTSKIMEQGDSL